MDYNEFGERDLSYDEFIEKEMDNRREEFLNKLSGIVHPKYRQQFAYILATAYVDGEYDAESLIDELDLGKIDICAMLDDRDAFEELLLKEVETTYYA